MTFTPDKTSAAAAMQLIPPEDRDYFRPLYVRDGDFAGIHCNWCLREWGSGHDKLCAVDVYSDGGKVPGEAWIIREKIKRIAGASKYRKEVGNDRDH